jgi:hypothetical protein
LWSNQSMCGSFNVLVNVFSPCRARLSMSSDVGMVIVINMPSKLNFVCCNPVVRRKHSGMIYSKRVVFVDGMKYLIGLGFIILY